MGFLYQDDGGIFWNFGHGDEGGSGNKAVEGGKVWGK